MRQADVPKLLTTFGNELDDLTEVAQSLDHPEEFKAPLDKLKHRLEGFSDAFGTLPTVSKEEAAAEHLSDRVTDAAFQGAQLLDNFLPFLQDYGKTGEQILDEAEKERQKAERWYNRCTLATYFSYSLGWCLSLIGKVYGAGSLTNE
jgi:hypothetical protein